jgi:hypothetical protein
MTRAAGLVAAVVCAGGCSVSVTEHEAEPVQQRTAPAAASMHAQEPLPELNRLAELTEALAKRRQETRRMEAGDPYSAEALVWSRLRCLTAMRAAMDRSVAVEAAQRHRDFLEARLKLVQDMQARGAAARADVDLMRYHLAEAVLWVAEAERGLPPTGCACPPPISPPR